MALSYQEVVSNGSLNTLALSIQFTAQEDISVLYDGAILPYNVTTGRSWVWSNGTTIRFRNDDADAPIPAGVVIRAERNTNVEEIRHVFSVQAGGGGSAKFTNQTMDENFRQFLYTAQESVERTDEAQEAVDQAILVAEGAVTTANAATNTANTALSTANTALDTADAVLDVANQAALDAASAVSTANSATATANNALGVATGIDAKAQEALDTANDAEDVALGIDAKAQSALDNSDAALLAAAGATTTANDAKDIAEGIDAKAQSALDTANALGQTVQDVADEVAVVYQRASCDHWGDTEPVETFPGMTWADTIARVLKRRNDDDTAWVIESRLLTAHMPILPDTDIPTTDIGPIYVVGQGDMEWNATAGTYVAMGGGAQGGGANKVFWVNDAVITEDFTVKDGTRAGSFGPLELADGVVVEVEPGGVWTVV